MPCKLGARNRGCRFGEDKVCVEKVQPASERSIRLMWCGVFAAVTACAHDKSSRGHEDAHAQKCITSSHDTGRALQAYEYPLETPRVTFH